jgi:hypothetical protein
MVIRYKQTTGSHSFQCVKYFFLVSISDFRQLLKFAKKIYADFSGRNI